MLAFIIFLLCVIQLGPGLVVVPVLIWTWVSMSTGHALLLTAFLVPLSVMDNLLKPILMGRGLTTPTLIIFLGVVGGALSYGTIGLFLGPVVLGAVLRPYRDLDRLGLNAGHRASRQGFGFWTERSEAKIAL